MGRPGELDVCKEMGTGVQGGFPVGPRCKFLGFRESWGTRGLQGRASQGTRGVRGRMS